MNRDGPGRVLRWRVGTARFAVPLVQVREVLPAMPATRIPGTAAVVRGLANLRGRTLVLLDGRLLLGVESRGAVEAVLVLDLPGQRVGIEVDEVEHLGPGDGLEGEYRMLDLFGLVGPILSRTGGP